MARRSITSAGLSVGAPCTCERKPSSLCFAAWVMPDLASCKLDSTSWVLFPMDETMPIPVMTTRLIFASPVVPLNVVCVKGPPRSTERRLIGRSANLRLRQRGTLLQEPDPQILGAIDNLVIGRKPAVGNAKPEL